MKKLFLNQPWILLLGLLLSLLSNQLYAQVTTATLSGLVKDSKGAGLASATVTVEYPDAGIKQVLVTKCRWPFYRAQPTGWRTLQSNG